MAQKTDAELLTEAGIIKNETTAGANTHTRVGTMLDNIIESKLNNEDAATGYLNIDGSNASSDVDLGSNSLNAKSFHIKGTGGAGHLGLKHQSANITANGNESSLGANSSGNPVWKNDGNTLETVMTDGQAGPIVYAMVSKTSPADNDSVLLSDSAASNGSKKLLWSNLKTAILALANAYADSLVVGLWDDRGNFDASGGSYPSTGGSGTAGAIKKGDIWTISVAGTLPTSQTVEIGDTVRALQDSPGNTQSNWSIQQTNIGYTPENSINKTDIITGSESNTTLYTSAKGVVDWMVQGFTTFIAGKATFDSVDSVVVSDGMDGNKTKTIGFANFLAAIGPNITPKVSTDADNDVVLGTDNGVYYKESLSAQFRANGLSLVAGAPVVIGGFNGASPPANLDVDSVLIVVAGLVAFDGNDFSSGGGSYYAWNVNIIADVQIFYRYKR